MINERKAKPKRPVEGHFNNLDEKQWRPQLREWIQGFTGEVAGFVHLTIVCVWVWVCGCGCVRVCMCKPALYPLWTIIHLGQKN